MMKNQLLLLKNKFLLAIQTWSLKVNSVLIKNVPQEERPRERLVKYGAKSLSTEELVAIILKTGTKDYSSVFLASQILSLVKDVTDLRNINLSTLIKINGVGAVKAIEFLAALELGRRVYASKILDNNLKLDAAEKIFNYFK